MRKEETLKQWFKKKKKRLSLFQKPGNFTSKFGCPDKCLVVHNWEIESHGVGPCVPLSSKCAPGIFFVEFWVYYIYFILFLQFNGIKGNTY